MKPPALFPGSTLGIIAPGSAPADPLLVDKGIAYLKQQGYRIQCYRTDFSPHGYLCGPDDVRIREMNHFLHHPEVDALIAIRGGYGALRLLPYLDYKAARNRPKLLIGYSDITALQMALYAQAGWTSLSGPMVSVEWGDPHPASEALFWSLASGARPEALVGPQGETLTPLRKGLSEGTLLGGNLSVLMRLMGTPYLPPLQECILVLEDVGEPPYRIDGLFAQLKMAGLFEQLGGVVLGRFTGIDLEPGKPTLSLEEVFQDYFGDAPFPVATNLAYGHFPEKATIPFGVRARLTVTHEAATLQILESVVQTDAV